MPDAATLTAVTNTITMLNALEREAQAAGLETSAGNTGDPSNLPDWMLAAVCPTLVIVAGDETLLTIHFQQGYIAVVPIDAVASFMGTETAPVEANADGFESIKSTVRKWIADHTGNAS